MHARKHTRIRANVQPRADSCAHAIATAIRAVVLLDLPIVDDLELKGELLAMHITEACMRQ